MHSRTSHFLGRQLLGALAVLLPLWTTHQNVLSQELSEPSGLAETTAQPLERANDEVSLLQQLEQAAGDFVIAAGEYHFGKTLEIDLKQLGSLSIRAAGPVTIFMHAAGPAIRIRGSLTGSADPKRIQPATWLQRMPTIDGVGIIGAHPEADGLELVQTLQPTLSRMHIRHVRHAITLSNRNRNVVISDVHLYDNSGIGIFLNEVDLHQINVGNSHISYNRGGGVVVRGGNVRNLHLTGCDIEANMPEDTTPTESGNVFIDCRTSGSVAEVAITGCTIQHNAHYHTAPQAPGGANIRIAGRESYQPNMIAITGNVLSDTHTHLHLLQTADVTFTGNTCFTTEPTDVLVENCSRIAMANNVFNPRESSATGEIVLRNSSYCNLNGLICQDLLAGPSAITLQNCHHSRISNCIVSGSRNGVLLQDCHDCTVTDCTITELPSSGRGVSLDGEIASNFVRDIQESHTEIHGTVEDFQQRELNPEWSWIRENKPAWRWSTTGLQVLVEPGNMWGSSNDANNLLVRPVPAVWQNNVDVVVEVEHSPQKRWEQADLVWFYDDTTMVKLGLELENDEISIVMGQELDDRTKTIRVIPYGFSSAQLRLVVDGESIEGFYRQSASEPWLSAGTTTLPAMSPAKPASISLQFYQGESGSSRWATIRRFEMKPNHLVP